MGIDPALIGSFHRREAPILNPDGRAARSFLSSLWITEWPVDNPGFVGGG